MTDQEIIRGIRDGNAQVFKVLFDYHYTSLCQYACTVLRDMDEAEDVVQAIFTKLWDKRTDLEVQQSVRTYLFRAVHNRCMNLLEHRKVVQQHQAAGAHAMQTAYGTPADSLPDELDQRIQEAIQSLPEQCRRIFMMSRYDELRYAEIAVQLNLSVNTIENQMSKALRLLREKLKDYIA